MLKSLGRWWRKRQPLGARAEREAARYLRRRGFRVLARNLRTRLGEIDLLAEDRAGVIRVVEVKAGVGESPPPEVHVNAAKQRKLTALAGQWLQRRPELRGRAVRFDVIAVVWPEGADVPTRLTHHENAFPASW